MGVDAHHSSKRECQSFSGEPMNCSRFSGGAQSHTLSSCMRTRSDEKCRMDRIGRSVHRSHDSSIRRSTESTAVAVCIYKGNASSVTHNLSAT